MEVLNDGCIAVGQESERPRRRRLGFRDGCQLTRRLQLHTGRTAADGQRRKHRQRIQRSRTKGLRNRGRILHQ